MLQFYPQKMPSIYVTYANERGKIDMGVDFNAAFYSFNTNTSGESANIFDADEVKPVKQIGLLWTVAENMGAKAFRATN